MAQKLPRLLIEEWLPAAAIGVECTRERSTGQQPPDKRLHVWWARRPLTVSRAAVLASLLPADFPRDAFERLLGFGKSGQELVEIRRLMDSGYQVPGGFGCDRAFKAPIPGRDLERLHEALLRLWPEEVNIIDPMAGGGSIPLEAARFGLKTLANEYNPVACSVLEATVDYPFRFGEKLAERTRLWARTWVQRIEKRLARFFPAVEYASVHAYIFARTVPCPDTHKHTPLVPDWHLFRRKGAGRRVVAEPVVDKKAGTWSVRMRELGRGSGQLKDPPLATYKGGKGTSLFTGRQIPGDYIKAMAQDGKMNSALYSIALKTSDGLNFRPPERRDLEALAEAARELQRLRPEWERANLIPTEDRYKGDCDRSYVYGLTKWADMFAPRQLLSMGILVEELNALRPQILKVEGKNLGEAVVHLLAFALDKFLNWNAILSSWNAPFGTARSVFDRHDFSFKPTFCEMAPCNSGTGVEWTIDNALGSYEELSRLARHSKAAPVDISLGSATNLPQIADKSITAVVVDPPYADNVQYSELADFFYVWLKRTQGHRRPEWFATYLCEHDQEAVVNLSRFKDGGGKQGKPFTSTGEARKKAHEFYQGLMTDIFRECRRILREDGALTVMFTHKKQEAWEALFSSLIRAGFTITATWPVKTESEHSLHQAKKNAAQSTVILVARKRPEGAGIGYFDSAMRDEIRLRARTTAERLKNERLNPVDQLVGSFGPAIEVYSRFDEVRTDTGAPVDVSQAIDEAADAVSAWRVEQLAERGLAGVEPEGRFTLLCWDVLGAAEFRFNEAKLLGHAVGMDVDQLAVAGLVTKSGDKVRVVPASDRRRDKPLEPDEVEETLFGPMPKGKKRRKADVLKIHPNDARFRTAIDGCHALALRYLEAKGGAAGIGSAKALALQQHWTKGSAVCRLMDALVHAAPEAVRFEKGKDSAASLFPEFRAWHALLEPLFGVTPLEWVEKMPAQGVFTGFFEDQESEEVDEETGDEE
jgi:putative DNA methylase